MEIKAYFAKKWLPCGNGSLLNGNKSILYDFINKNINLWK